MKQWRLGYLHPAREPFLSSAALEPSVVGQLDGPCRIVDLPVDKGEWAALADLDFPAWVERGIDLLYYSPRNFHALPFIARERGGVGVPILTMAYCGARWLDVWLLAAPLLRPRDLLLVPTRSARDEIRRAVRADPHLVSNPFGLDFESVHRAMAGAAPPEDGVRLLFLGRVVPEKGPQVAIEALARLGDVPGIGLEIAGPCVPSYAQELRELAGRLGVDDRVRIRPPVEGPEKYRFLAGGSVLVLPTVYPGETAASVVMEALAVGLPVVASAWAGIPEFIEPGVNGELVPVREDRAGPGIDAGALAAVLRPLVTDRSRLLGLTRGALASAGRFDRSVTRQELLGRLAGGRARIAGRWEGWRQRTLGSCARRVNPSLLRAEQECLARGEGPFGIPPLAETTFGWLLEMLDQPETLRRWRRRWDLVFRKALMGPEALRADWPAG